MIKIDKPIICCFLVLKKHGKFMSFLRLFFNTRPERIQLKQSGIVKERVFGCDLGEHLLNSGHDGRLFRGLCLVTMAYVFIVSFSINDVAIFGCVIDKQYDSLSDLIIILGIAKKQITFYRLFLSRSIGPQNILIIFICASIFAKCGS